MTYEAKYSADERENEMDTRTQMQQAPYVVVEDAGGPCERGVATGFDDYEDAARWAREHYEPGEQDELHVDIMRRLPDGTLTTEY